MPTYLVRTVVRQERVYAVPADSDAAARDTLERHIRGDIDLEHFEYLDFTEAVTGLEPYELQVSDTP